MIELHFDGNEARQTWRASLLHAVDVWNEIALVEVRGTPRLRLVADRATLTGYDLFRVVVRRLRLLWPVALLTWLPGTNRVGGRLWPPEKAGPAD